VKCHSNMLSSSGEAEKSAEGFCDSSAASFIMRFMVGFLVLNDPMVAISAIQRRSVWRGKDTVCTDGVQEAGDRMIYWRKVKLEF